MSLFKYTGKRLKKSYKRAPNLSTNEWAAKNVYFTGTEVSPITGSFQVKYSPHLIKLFDLYDTPSVRKMFGKWASQSAKSLFELIIIGKRLDTEPTNVLYMQPIKDDIPKIVDVKVDPVLRCMPSLWRKFDDYKSTESIRAKRELKRLAGGSLIISGSSVKERKSLTVPMLVMDEIGEFESGAVAESEERTKAYSRFFPKIVGVSTIVHPKDEICVNYDACEAKMEWHYVCRGCSHHFYPDRDLFKFPSKASFAAECDVNIDKIDRNAYLRRCKQEVHVECPNCGHKITSDEKDDMLLNGDMDWFFVEGDETATTYGFDMNSLGSYFVPYELLVENLINADEDPVKLDKIYRGWFNKFYKREVDKVETDDMFLLGNSLPEWVVPKGTYKVYMGVDTQKDHFWFEVKAYCFGKQSHSIASGRLETFGDIEDIWEYAQNLEGEDGEIYHCSKMGIDRRGYNQDGVKRTDEVDAFVEYMVSKWKNGDENRIYATEGHSALSGDKAFSVASTRDYSSNRTKIDIKVLKLSNIYLKNSVRRAIERTIAKMKGEDEVALGYETNLFYVNQTTIDADMMGTTSKSYTKQLTAEVYDYAVNPKTGKIDKEKSWINPKKLDNHLFDTSVICEGFAEMDKVTIARRGADTENLKNALRGVIML